ncbi:MAG: PadR family transcriptional regulator [Longimicrobiales bacterium]|jgi:DNA-binding PadR family transcriptional regulator
MKKNWFFILVSLAAGDRHGLAIMRDVLELTEGAVKLWPAALYGSLDELLDQGWIEELGAVRRRPEGESERKRYYRITKSGRVALVEETDRLAGLVRAARSRMKEA